MTIHPTITFLLILVFISAICGRLLGAKWGSISLIPIYIGLIALWWHTSTMSDNNKAGTLMLLSMGLWLVFPPSILGIFAGSAMRSGKILTGILLLLIPFCFLALTIFQYVEVKREQNLAYEFIKSNHTVLDELIKNHIRDIKEIRDRKSFTQTNHILPTTYSFNVLDHSSYQIGIVLNVSRSFLTPIFTLQCVIQRDRRPFLDDECKPIVLH